ncbi:MAG: hypothetical protein SFV32_03480 [Opitutaceae bacterium]|nr:hypothetical protein [Opitutaceae bacterium]
MRAEIKLDESGRRVLRTPATPLKWAALALSVVIVAVGIAELGWVVSRITSGHSCTAKVVSVKAAAPGAESREYQAGAAAGQSLATVYTYFVECTPEGGAPARFELNVSNKGTPTFAVGDTVAVAHPSDATQPAIAVKDFRTWSVGVFVTAVGLCYLVVSGAILLRGRKPVELPEGETL